MALFMTRCRRSFTMIPPWPPIVFLVLLTVLIDHLTVEVVAGRVGLHGRRCVTTMPPTAMCSRGETTRAKHLCD